jgi:hypothetical protein
MARNKTTAARAKKSGAATMPKHSVVPDRLDLRDRLYMPSVAVVPGLALDPMTNIPVLDQGQTNACTGFALASVVYHLQATAKRKQMDFACLHSCCIRWHGAMMNFPAMQMPIPDRVCAGR